MAEELFGGMFILGLVALAMILFGYGDIKSDIAVNFYNLEEGPDIKDKEIIKKWNKIHGTMWIVYGLCFVIVALYIGFGNEDKILGILSIVLLVLPLPVMVIIHEKVKKKLLK